MVLVLFLSGGINNPGYTNVQVSSHPCECKKTWTQAPQTAELPSTHKSNQPLTPTFRSWHSSQHLCKREPTSKGFLALSFACLWLSRSSLVSWPYLTSPPSLVSKSTLVFFSNINYTLSWGSTQGWWTWFPAVSVSYPIVLNCVERWNVGRCLFTM